MNGVHYKAVGGYCDKGNAECIMIRQGGHCEKGHSVY